MSSDFYRVEPTAQTSWRLAVLMGANSHTLKFALGSALLEFAAEGRTEVGLDELAVPCAMGLLRHLASAPQAQLGTADGPSDLLAVAARESERSLALGLPTDELRYATVRSLPAMVLRRFHHLGDGSELPHRFYEVTGSPSSRTVGLTPELLAVADCEQAPNLRAELDARWRIVESSFDPEVGRSLVEDGFAVDREALALTDRSRRRPVAGLSAALIGFQHGRCQICGDAITPDDSTAVDHVFPLSLMARANPAPDRNGPDLDAVWNLAPAHVACDDAKGDRLPNATELQRLARRNEAVMQSPYPLRRTLQRPLQQARILGEHADRWPTFLLQVLKGCR